MKKRKIIKVIKESQVLTKQEKKELIKKAKIENFVNGYKIFLKLPFLILGILFATLTMVFASISELFDLMEQVFSSICIRIDNLKEFVITNNNTREKILKEIKEKNNKKCC